MNQYNYDQLRELLLKAHDFPCSYSFKFFVTQDFDAQVLDVLLPDATVRSRPSSSGRYICYSYTMAVASVDDVISVYEQAHQLPGIIKIL